MKYILGTPKPEPGFRELLAIGCWNENISSVKFQKANCLRGLKRIENILLENINIDKTDTLVLICAWGFIKNSDIHPMELLMPLVRRFGYVLLSEDHIDFDGVKVHMIKLSMIKANDKLTMMLYKANTWDCIENYYVNKKEGIIMAEAIFKIVGITMSPETKRIAHQICKKFPKLRFGEGEKPQIRLTRVFYSPEFPHENAVSVNLMVKGKEYRIGWLSARDEEIIDDFTCVPNEFITGFLRSDDESLPKDKIIQGVELSSFGDFQKEGKQLYWGKVMIDINLDKIK